MPTRRLLSFFAPLTPLVLFFSIIGELHHLQFTREQQQLRGYLLSVPPPPSSRQHRTSSTTTTTTTHKNTTASSFTVHVETSVVSSRPPLESLIDSYGNITGNVQFLLDFSIIGFGKCGTTAILDCLKGHSEIQAIEAEVWDMVLGHPEAVVQKLYNLPSDGPQQQYKRGYKSPREIVDARVLRYYRTYFPDTKLLVGIRHPVLWFESLYNFRVQNLKVKQTDSMPHPNSLIGVCTRGMRNTCTEKGNFAKNLLLLGKQNVNNNGAAVGGGFRSSERTERVLSLYKHKWFNATEVPAMSNSVFLFDVAQLGGVNETRSHQFRSDVQQFLGLGTELPALVHSKPGKVWGPVVQAKKDKYRIDICDDEFVPLRENLMTISRLNADWIRNEFLNYPDVHCSSRDYLVDELLEGWMHDPCDDRRRRSAPAEQQSE